MQGESVSCKLETSRRWHLMLSVVSLCCFWNSLRNGLVHDDVYAITSNQDVRPETPLSNIFKNDFWGRNLQDEKSHKSFRPLCTLTFRMNYVIHGLNPLGYHLVNVLLHTAVVNVYFYILHKLIFLQIVPSVLVALMFAVHPVHVEAVTGVVGRGDVLSCLLFLCTFLNYTRHLQKSQHDHSLFSYNFVACILLGTASLFVKEHSVTVLGVCVVYDIMKNRHVIVSLLFSQSRESTCTKENKRTPGTVVIRRTVFLIVLLIFLFCIRMHIMGSRLPTFLEEDNPASFSPHVMSRILTYMYLCVFNFSLLLAPITLSYDWQVGSIPQVESLSDMRNIQTLFAVFVFMSLIVVTLFRLEKDSSQEIPLVGFIFMVIPFLPASNFLFRVGFVVAERILYIPSMGFFITVGHGFNTIIEYIAHNKSSKLLLVTSYTFFGLLIFVFSLKTVTYSNVWFSRETLFKSGVDTVPHNAKAHYNYANFLKDSNLSAEAIYHYKQAVHLYPSHSSSHNNLGSLLKSDEEAEYHFLQALKYTPGHYRAMLNLGATYWRMGRIEEAEKMLLNCLRHSPGYFDAQNLLVDVLQKQKKYNEANAVYNRMLATNKSQVDLLMKYAVFLQETDQTEQSIDIYKLILAGDSTNYNALCSFGKAYEQAGRREEAISVYRRALLINPQELKAYHSLALHYVNRGKVKAAKDVYEQSVIYSKPTPEHFRNYAAVLFQLGQSAKPVAILEKLIKEDNGYRLAHTTLISFLVDTKDKMSEQAISRALKVFPKDIEIRLHLADWKRNIGQYEEAKKYLFGSAG